MLSTKSCRAGIISAVIFTALLVYVSDADAQGLISSSTSRPFVTGIEPMLGPKGNVVGGVLVDAKGIVRRAQAGSVARLRRMRKKLLQAKPLSTKVAQRSSLRKVSLRKLEEEIYRLREQNKPLTEEVLYLAGLQRIQYVVVVPERNDIILAGFAEGWQVDANGEYVGVSTGRPVMNLDDLIVALRTAEAATRGRGISCSIDPTEEGLKRFTKVAARIRGKGKAVAQRIARAVGKQQVTISGVPRSSHFARVLVAADYRMKSLAMALERSPVPALPSYMQLLQADGGFNGNLMPRWWMEPKYESVRHDKDRLTWELNGGGVKVLSHLERTNQNKDQSVQVKRWADLMTRHYDQLSRSIAALGKLRNCMDLAVVGALILKEDLTGRAKNPLRILLDRKNVKFTPWNVPAQIDSQASFVQRAGRTIVSVSGGVSVDSWKPLQKVSLKTQLAKVRRGIQWKRKSAFWWD